MARSVCTLFSEFSICRFDRSIAWKKNDDDDDGERASKLGNRQMFSFEQNF